MHGITSLQSQSRKSCNPIGAFLSHSLKIPICNYICNPHACSTSFTETHSGIPEFANIKYNFRDINSCTLDAAAELVMETS